MKKVSTLLWLIPLIVVLLLLPFIIPSSVISPDAFAEGMTILEEEQVPVYKPVTLANPDAEPLPLPKTSAVAGNVTPYMPHPDGFTRDEDGNLTGYLDGTISVRVEEGCFHNTKVLFTWIQIADASQFRAAFSGRYPQNPETRPTNMTKGLHSVVAINGDWCIGHNYGLVARNGKQLRKAKYGNYDALLIDFDGNFHVLKTPGMKEINSYDGKVMHSFVFGPALVIDGEVQQYVNEKRAMNIPARHQRQAICQIEELSYLIITTEGPEQSKDGGFNINELAQLAYDCGAKQAYNLDGGSSTWLLLENKRINNLKTLNPRFITDMIYFVTAEPDPASGK